MRSALARRASAAAFTALLAVPVALRAQDASEILRTALERHAERVADVQDYTIEMEFMGQQTTTYLVKKEVDGYPVFVSPEQAAGEDRLDDPYAAFAQAVDRATYAGTETIDGEESHVLEIADPEGIALAGTPAGPGTFEPTRMTIALDTDEHVARRLVIEGDLTHEGKTTPITLTALLQDYRTVEGMPHPFRTSVTVDGALAAAGQGDEARAREQLEQLEEQLAQMPPEQREMMEKAMGSQLERLRSLADTGSLEMTMTVTNLEVNTGPPAEGS